MKKILFVTCLSMGIVGIGCQPAEKPVETTGQAPAAIAEFESASDAEVVEVPSEPPAAAPVPKYSEEQVAAAKQLAMDLGVVVKEDADGNVILIDTAANRSWVDDDKMQQMLVFGGLTSLTVEGPTVTDALAPRIAEQTSLESLAMRNTLIGDAGIAQLAALESLRVIDLRVSPLVTDAAMKTLAKMPELRAVRLTGGNVTDAGVATLLDLPRLTELDVRGCRGVTQEGIAKLAGKKSLRVLKVGGPKIDDQVLEVIAGLGNLNRVALENCDITDPGVAKLAKLPLVELTIYQCVSVTDEGLKILAGYTQLEHLTLRDVAAKGSALAKLPHPEKLVSLNMAQSGIGDAEVRGIVKMTNLQSLNLSETTLTDAAIESLSKMGSVKQLMLTQTGISAEGMERLRRALPECSIRSD